MARDLRSPGIVKKTPEIEGMRVINYFSARNADFCRTCPKCVSLLTNITECGVRVDFAEVEITENCWYYPPPPKTESRRLLGSRKNSATTPPTESRRLLGIPEKNSATTPPPPPNRVGFRGSRKNSATTPPTESRRLLEITEKNSRNSTTSTWQLCGNVCSNSLSTFTATKFQTCQVF